MEPMKSSFFNLDRLFISAFWSALVFALVMALLPQPPSVPAGDKVQHMVAFAVLAGLGSRAYHLASLLKLGIGLAAFGGLIEILQSIPVLHRDASLRDWAADCVAIAVVLVLTHLRRRGTARSFLGK